MTERIKVTVKNSSDWSDHVFTLGYKLRTLAEVKQHIQRTEYLPGVALAKEMVERGNDLHKTDAKLLKKIEELTLYSIEQEKTNQQQQLTLQEQSAILQRQQGEIDELKRLINQLRKK